MNAIGGQLEKYSVAYRTIDERLRAEKGFPWVFALVLDCAIGIGVAHLLKGLDLYEIVWPFVDARIGHLDEVITWLLSNPVGLKLNEPLNTALASFFRYHIYLWHTFVRMLRVPAIWANLPLALYAGISFAAALFADLVSIFSMHIVCFYIYALRLFLLTFTSLGSLWRAFRGQKYNPLRKRVDTAHLDSRQLFLATLLFVVLLFLAPTVTVYCFVFSMLRWVVRGFQLAIERIAELQCYVHMILDRFRSE
ncbi:unnamed protein product, partial [Mesorhabditis spiculigera]